MRSLPVVFQYSGQPLDLIHPGRAILGLAHLGLAVGANLIRLAEGHTAPETDIFIRPEEMGVIGEELYNALRLMTREQMEVMLSDCGLTQDEINRAWDRKEALIQKRIYMNN